MVNKLDRIFIEEIEKLRLINGISFTNREVDIISCIICGKNAKSISNLLSTYDKDLSQRSVETHIFNIRRKIGALSKNNIIDFVEKSDQYKQLHRHYTDIILWKEIDKCIIKLKPHTESSEIFLKIESNFQEKDFLLKFLSCFLQKVFIKIHYNNTEDDKEINSVKIITISIKDNTSNGLDTYEYIILSTIAEKKILLKTNRNSTSIDQSVEYDLSRKEEIYLIFFNIIKILFPSTVDIINESIKTIQHRLNSVSCYNETSVNVPNIAPSNSTTNQYLLQSLPNIFKNKVYFIIITVFMLTIPSFYFYQYEARNDFILTTPFLIPEEDLLLKRTSIINEITSKLESSEGINSVVLIGDGGSGKSTIARQLANSVKPTLTWEINAETKKSTKDSFEKLASSIGKLNHDDNISNIISLKNSEENEDKLIDYVRRYLFETKNWLLIFDNLEDFTSIQKFYPNNENLWGNGKIVITTRNANFGNNSFIKNSVHISSLTSEQQLELFLKIHKKQNKSEQINLDKIKSFLQKIPPFPLDIVIAANYINTTHTSLDAYLNSLSNNDKHFNNIQTSIIKETSSYSGTRNSIISLAIEKILAANYNFVEPLIIASALDANNIPKILIDDCSDNLTSDEFVYFLKKYSLISQENVNEIGYTLGMHRAIQASIFDYLNKNLDKEILTNHLTNISKILKSRISQLLDTQEVSKIKILFNQSRSFLEHESLLTQYTKCSLGAALGEAYDYLGYYHPEIRTDLEKNITCLENTGGTKKEITSYRTSLAHMYRKAGIYDKAEKMYLSALQNNTKLDEKSLDLAILNCYLGAINEKLGKYKIAKQLLDKGIKVLSEGNTSHTALARGLTQLGIYHTVVGEYQKAVNVFETSINITTQNRSIENPMTAWNFIGLGRSYNMIKEYAKSQKSLDYAIKLLTTYFPHDEISIAWANAELGTLSLELKKYEQAEDLYKKTLKVYEKVYGTEHTFLALIYNRIAYLYLTTKKYDECENYANISLNIFKHSDNHPLVFVSLETLGELYIEKSKNAKSINNLKNEKEYKLKAIEYLKESLNIANANLPESSECHERIAKKLESTARLL